MLNTRFPFINWTPPTSERVELQIHPEVRDRLRNTLMYDERFHAVGYSGFLMQALAVDVQLTEPWQAPDHERVTIKVHPLAYRRLARAIMHDSTYRAHSPSQVLMAALDRLATRQPVAA